MLPRFLADSIRLHPDQASLASLIHHGGDSLVDVLLSAAVVFVVGALIGNTAFQLVAGLKLPWPAAMGVIFLEGAVITVLVLTGVTRREDAERFSYRASRIVESVAELVDELG